MSRAYHLCQQCHGTGIISRIYMSMPKGAELHTMTACPCAKDLIEVPAVMGRKEVEG